MALKGAARWPGALPPAGPVPSTRRATWQQQLNMPPPELANGRPRVFRSLAHVQSEVGHLSWASPPTAIAAYLVIAVAGSMPFTKRPDVFVLLAASLLGGIVVGRARFRGSFTGVPAFIPGAALFALVEVVVVLVSLPFGDPSELVLLAGPVAFLVVLGFDWNWAERIRWLALGSLVVAMDTIGKRTAPLPLVAVLVLATVLLLWSAQRDSDASRRRLAPLSGGGLDVGDDESRFELNAAFVIAALLAAVLVPILVIPSLSWDFKAPSIDGTNPFAELWEAIKAWLSSVFGDTPPADLRAPEWLRTLAEALGELVDLARPAVAWVLPKVPYVIVGVILFFLGRRTARAWRAWQRALANRRWGARVLDELDAAGRAHGRSRRPHETIGGYAMALHSSVLPDERLIRLAHLATESCFAPQEVAPDAVAEGTRLLDGLLADHPPPPRATRVLRSSA